MNKQKLVLNYLINLSFFLYFITLITERLISIISSFVHGINIFSDGFNGYTYLTVFISIVSFFIYLFLKCKDNMKAIFKPNNSLKYTDICISSGILLVSGMVHTEYTYPVIQFISYGILILGILLKLILNLETSKDKLISWLSFIYLVCFSMAIPVMYRTLLEYHVFYHILEAITSLILVGIFTYLMIILFNEKENLFILWCILLAIILDALLIGLRWKETINLFVLIFISLSLILFIAGYLVIKFKDKKLNK